MNEQLRRGLGLFLSGFGDGDPMVAMQMAQRRKDAEKVGAMFAPQQDPNFPSPTSPTNSAPTFGTKAGMPDIKTLAPLLLANPQFAGPVLEMLKMMQPEKATPYKPNTQIAPNGLAVDLNDPANIGQSFARPEEVKPPTAPQTRTRHDGDKEIIEQFNPQSGGFDKVSEAPRWQPAGPAGQGEQESWAQPIVEAGPDGKPILVRYSNRRGREVVEGATPAQTSAGQPTADQARSNQLYTRAKEQLPVVLENFEALSSPSNQAAAAVHPSMSSSAYQRASNALADIAASYLYSVSGATATPSEIQGTVERVRPKVGESAESRADKKRRLQDMVDSIKQRSSSPNTPQPGVPISAAPPASGGWKIEKVGG